MQKGNQEFRAQSQSKIGGQPPCDCVGGGNQWLPGDCSEFMYSDYWVGGFFCFVFSHNYLSVWYPHPPHWIARWLHRLPGVRQPVSRQSWCDSDSLQSHSDWLLNWFINVQISKTLQSIWYSLRKLLQLLCNTSLFSRRLVNCMYSGNILAATTSLFMEFSKLRFWLDT